MDDQLQKLVDGYRLSSETVKLVRNTPILLLVGVSGAGKDTIKHRLLDTGKYHHIVSHTTRPMRENAGVMEQDGIEYHFISPTKVIEMLELGAFVEAKKYSGNVYGTSASEIERARDEGKIATTDLEVQGVAEYKAISDNVIAVFILPPSYEEWQRRLHARYGEKGADPVDIAKRMQTAITELQEALKQPYYHFIINDDLDTAVATVDKIAHNHDEFNTVDVAVRDEAVLLLNELQKNL